MDALDSNTTGLYSDARDPPYKMIRQDRGQLLSKMSFAESYTRNTAKEDLCIQFAETFRAQFVHLYPGRAPLLLSPLNECHVQKFVSTFIRPTLLPYSSLYDADKCAAFVADYVMYEPLADSEALPQNLSSPTTVLRWQVGNCVEMSVLLCSMIVAAGYNAYVVLGCVTPEVATNNQEGLSWPEALPQEVDSDAEAENHGSKETMFTKYLKKRPVLESTFDANYDGGGADAVRRASLAPPRRKSQAIGDDEVDAQTEAAEVRCSHAWVVVLPAKRHVTEPFFFEPSTGVRVSTSDPRYLGIEAIFDQHNYFVHMEPSRTAAQTPLNLYDLADWEHLFLGDPRIAAASAEAEEKNATGDATGASAHIGVPNATDATVDAGAGGDFAMELPASWVEPLTLSLAQFENCFPGRNKETRYADAVVRRFARYSDPELRVLEVQLPDESQSADQLHTLFAHRADRLRRRSVYPALERHQEPRCVQEWFDPGRKRDEVEGLKEIVDEPGVRKTLKFYWRAREDGLCSRTELFASEKDTAPRKVLEHYRGRDDRLIYRSATFDADAERVRAELLLERKGAGQDDGGPAPVSMTERFARNPDLPAEEDVMKRTFVKPLSADGEIWVWYHYPDDCITQPIRLFPKNAEKTTTSMVGMHGGGATDANTGLQPKAIVMPNGEKPKESRLRQQLRELIAAEKDCIAELKAKRDDVRALAATRQSESHAPQPLLSVFDTLRNRRRETDADREAQRAEENRRAASRKDKLAPYIATLEDAKDCRGDFSKLRLKEEDAKFVRDSALKDLKERLIQRGHIMQARMDHEKEELTRQQMLYQKNLDSAESAKDGERFSAYLQEATWRMKILDNRLTAHIDQAAAKYAALAEELARDSRLASIYPKH